MLLLEFKEIPFGSNIYGQTLELRERVLRTPLGLTLSAEDTLNEDLQRHFAMVEGNTLIACVVCRPLDDGKFKLRQMAVSPAHQGRGVGQQLITAVEAVLGERGCRHVEMSARQSAIGFYEKLGYRITGSGYVEQGIPHVKMEKRIRADRS